MWINPKYADSYPAKAAPQDDGKPLETFPRADGREELRVVLKTYRGRPYVSIRIWERDQAGEFWPMKGKGISIRISEAAGVAEALASVASLGEGSNSPGRSPARPERRETDQPQRQTVERGATSSQVHREYRN